MATYTAVTQQTVAEIVAQSPTYAKQILWVADIHFDKERYNPFAELMGGFGSVKPIKEVMDTQKVRGTTIVITQEAGLGGKGQSGVAATLIGNEEKRKYSQFTVSIGLHRHAVAEDKMTKDQTFIGSTFDRSVRRGLREWVNRLKCDCIEACMLAEATSRNTLYAGNRASIDTLGSTDVLTRTTIRQAKIMAGGLGTTPIAIGTAKGNQRILKYYLQGNDALFDGLVNNTSWESLLATAGDRGDNNYIFGGHLPELDGVLLNNWTISNTSADAAQGAFCAPRAYLGVEYAATTTATCVDIKGGGYNGDSTLTTNAAAKAGTDYFRYFPNAPFAAFDRTIIAADTSTRRYLMIQHASGADVGKFSFFSYKICDGYFIESETEMERLGDSATGDIVTTLTGSSITWNSAPWTSGYLSKAIIPTGSLIIPVNAKGQPYVRGYLLGQDAVLCGYGSIDGKPSTAMGQRVEEKQDYGKNIGIGIEMVWGVKAMENAAKIVNGYIVLVAAYNLPGMPEITGG